MRELYGQLTNLADPRVRKTLAFSLHELSKILGPEITEEELAIVAEKYLKDHLNEVKSGVLQNLHLTLENVSEEC